MAAEGLRNNYNARIDPARKFPGNRTEFDSFLIRPTAYLTLIDGASASPLAIFLVLFSDSL